ncbi:MAG: hypothetical protein ABJG68_12280 [Crocinitomicaceae bacterium]
MIDCSKAGQMMEQREFEKLGWWARRKLKLHMGVCKACKKYENDNHVLAKILKMASSKHCDTALSPEEKSEIKSKLADQ